MPPSLDSVTVAIGQVWASAGAAVAAADVELSGDRVTITAVTPTTDDEQDELDADDAAEPAAGAGSGILLGFDVGTSSANLDAGTRRYRLKAPRVMTTTTSATLRISANPYPVLVSSPADGRMIHAIVTPVTATMPTTMRADVAEAADDRGERAGHRSVARKARARATMPPSHTAAADEMDDVGGDHRPTPLRRAACAPRWRIQPGQRGRTRATSIAGRVGRRARRRRAGRWP